MISAADFDEVFGWNPASTTATSPGARVLDQRVVALFYGVPLVAHGHNALGQAMPGEVRHSAQIPQAAVETRPRDLATVEH